ncbi:MAG: hypothetical protein KBB94_00430 [Legionellaceae bacterium]|nr:hypothetical protein [Legionellaceae bacterium]MBP9774379.1 hypothetical protein [Legionellaceae bacterium]
MFNLTYSKKRRLLLILVFGLIAVLFARGLQLHLAKKITDRIKFHAIPVAISELYHHHPHDYTGIIAVERPFQSLADTETLIKNAILQDVTANHENYYWVADDKGFNDYVIASFYLFGPHLKSMYYMWFVILLTSVIFFLSSFHKQTGALGFLCLILLSMHVAVSTLALASVYSLDSIAWRDALSSVSLYETRFLDVLALISVFHMLFFVSGKKSFLWLRDGVPLLGQIGIFIFLYHSRSSLGWELMAVFIYCLCNLLSKKRKSTFTNNSKSPIIVATALCSGLFLLNGYKHMTYNPLYFSEMGHRTFWHNALMGLASDSTLANEYHVDFGDFNVAQSVINFSKKSNLCTPDIMDQEPQKLLNSLGNWGTVNWINYENCAKKLFFEIATKNKLAVIRLYAITKPLSSLTVVRMAMRKTSDPILERIRSKYGMKWSPFNMINVGFLLVIFSLSFEALHRMRKRYLQMTIIVLIASFIPSVAFYPDILTEGGLITILPMTLYVGFSFVIYGMHRTARYTQYDRLLRKNECLDNDKQDDSSCSV